ncbi:hypothetical protein CP971_32810 [Streptomyces viridifaciens]|nr:hypothetical protein CP971_32810 [Streptomyces viridifaciens]
MVGAAASAGQQPVTEHRLLRGGVVPGGTVLRSLPDHAALQLARPARHDRSGLPAHNMRFNLSCSDNDL